MFKGTTRGLDVKQRECVELLMRTAQRHHIGKVFADFCELSAISISNAIDRLQRVKREARYREVIKAYDSDEMLRFSHMLGRTIDALQRDPNDHLGTLYMHLELGSATRGQYFTPMPIARMMAEMSCGDAHQDAIRDHGFISVAEPAVGSGVMVIALAMALKARGINPQQQMHVVATDCDILAVHMAYIQLSLLGLPAVVIHGNSLSGQILEHWVTPFHALRGWDARLKLLVVAECERAEPERGSEVAAPEHAMSQFRDTVVLQRFDQLKLL